MSARRSPDGRPPELSRPHAGPVLAVSVVLGWLGHDLLMFILSGEPKLVLEGAPHTFVVLGLAAVLGLLFSAVPELLTVFLLGAGAAALALPRIGLGADLTTTQISLAGAIFSRWPSSSAP